MENEYIGREQAAQRLGVSGKTLNRLANDGVLTKYRPQAGGREVFYSTQEIDAIKEMRPVSRDAQEVYANA